MGMYKLYIIVKNQKKYDELKEKWEKEIKLYEDR